MDDYKQLKLLYASKDKVNKELEWRMNNLEFHAWNDGNVADNTNARTMIAHPRFCLIPEKRVV